MAPIKVDEIRALLSNRITIREAFEKAGGLCCVATWKKGDSHENYTLIQTNEFEPADLPESGEYLETEEKEHDSYLKLLDSRCDFNKEGMADRRVCAQSVFLKDLHFGYNWQYRFMTKDVCPKAAGNRF